MLFERQRNGVEPEPRKMSDVNKKKTFGVMRFPRSVLEPLSLVQKPLEKLNSLDHLKTFDHSLGLARNIRKYVNNFAIIAGPLHDLVAQLTKSDKTNKNMVIDSSCWTKVCEDSFVELKHTLMDT